MQAVSGLVDQPGDRGQGHLLRQGQHQCLEQWREAGELAGTVRLNLDNPPFEQLHPRRLTSRQLGKITGCATAWCGRHGPDATIRHLAPQTGCRRQVKADLTTFSAASKSTPHPECVFTMSDATQHTRPTQIAMKYQTPDSGVFSEDGSARFVRSPQALQTQQHGEHALEFAI